MTLALPIVPVRPAATAWRDHGLALAATIAALLALFRADVAAIVATWWTSSTFQHCFVVAAVVAWLVWQRREALATRRPVAWGAGLAVVAGGSACWLVGEAGTVTVLRQLGLLAMIEGAVVTLLGPRIARGLAFPLGYALFLVPFGEWMEAPLQSVTVRLSLPLLHVVGIPARADGVLIHAGRYWFEVAEACSGAKFVIAMAAMGVLVGHVCYCRWSRRLAFLVLCLIVPVLANGVRAAATMAVADRTSVEAAAGLDHIVYGWVWFGVVMAATLAIGWRWFDRPADAPALDPRHLRGSATRQLPLAPAAAMVLMLAAASAGWGYRASGRVTPLPAVVALPSVPGWHRTSPATGHAQWAPAYPDADRRLIGRYVDRDGDAVDLAVALYQGQRRGHSLVAYGNGAVGAGWLRVADLAPIAGAPAMRIAAPGGVSRIVTTRYVVGGVATTSGVIVRLTTLRAHLLGGDQTAAAIHVSAPQRQGRDAAAAIRRFAAALSHAPPR